MKINLEELTETELWLVETMVRQMNVVVDQLYKILYMNRGYQMIGLTLKKN